MNLGTRTTLLVRRSVVLAVLATLMLSGTFSAGAQELPGPLSCDFYETYDEAQAAFDDGLKDNEIQDLDLDGDGVVCEDTFGVGDGEQNDNFATCATFANQEDAQSFLDGNPNDDEIEALDADGNGIACENEFGNDDEQEVPGQLSCSFYETYEDAQLAFDDGLKDNEIQDLDLDGDGVVCEDTFLVGDGEQVQDFATCVTFANQEDAQNFLDSAPTDEEIEALDPDGNGIACEAGVGPDEEEVAETPDESDDSASDDVVALPATGSGSGTAGFDLIVLVSGFAAVAMTGASLLIRISGLHRQK